MNIYHTTFEKEGERQKVLGRGCDSQARQQRRTGKIMLIRLHITFCHLTQFMQQLQPLCACLIAV